MFHYVLLIFFYYVLLIFYNKIVLRPISCAAKLLAAKILTTKIPGTGEKAGKRKA